MLSAINELPDIKIVPLVPMEILHLPSPDVPVPIAAAALSPAPAITFTFSVSPSFSAPAFLYVPVTS